MRITATLWSPFPAVAPTVLTVLLLAACGEPRFHEQDNPLRLSDWNLFTQEGSLLLPQEQTMVFQPANPLFSDYAGKLRTLWLPEGQPARIEQGELEFPPGAVLSKTFYYPTDGEGAVLDTAGNADRLDRRRHRILETRLLVRRMDGWHAMAYVWNEAQSEAFLRVAGASIPLRLGRKTGAEDFVYFVPNENQCAGCHVTSHPDGPLRPLGAVPAQLAAADYLQTMEARGWLDRAPETPAAPSWEDESADLATRAGAYLDIHCGHCHNPDGAADTSALVLDGSHGNPLELGVCKSPVAAGGGAGDLLYSIHPGAPERSILLYRMESAELDEMMPELGRSLIHAEGVALIRDWIAGMAGDCPEPVRALGACAAGIHGCKSALIHAPGRSISLHIHQYSPQPTGQGRGDSEFSLSRIPAAQAPSVLSHKFAAFQSGPEASMQGAVRGQYREYCQGRQRRSGASGPLPKGASPAARGRVALLGNGAGHYLRTAPCHTPRGAR